MGARRRALFACHGLPIESQIVSQMVDRVLALPEGTRLYLLAPVVRGRRASTASSRNISRKFQRVKIDSTHELAEAPTLDKKFPHDIDVVVDRIVVRDHRPAAGGKF
jgi:excinuclease ABC subunit A